MAINDMMWPMKKKAFLVTTAIKRPSTTESNKKGKGQNLYLTKPYIV